MVAVAKCKPRASRLTFRLHLTSVAADTAVSMTPSWTQSETPPESQSHASRLLQPLRCHARRDKEHQEEEPETRCVASLVTIANWLNSKYIIGVKKGRKKGVTAMIEEARREGLL
jgi:hypothetical protein